MKFYIDMVYGMGAATKCFDEINQNAITILKSVQNIINNDKHCFEMYGFDILIDANCKPWIVEINASPSLSTTSKVDLDLKTELINDVYKIVMPDDWNEDSSKTGANTCTAT